MIKDRKAGSNTKFKMRAPFIRQGGRQVQEWAHISEGKARRWWQAHGFTIVVSALYPLVSMCEYVCLYIPLHVWNKNGKVFSKKKTTCFISDAKPLPAAPWAPLFTSAGCSCCLCICFLCPWGKAATALLRWCPWHSKGSVHAYRKGWPNHEDQQNSRNLRHSWVAITLLLWFLGVARFCKLTACSFGSLPPPSLCPAV